LGSDGAVCEIRDLESKTGFGTFTSAKTSGYTNSIVNGVQMMKIIRHLADAVFLAVLLPLSADSVAQVPSQFSSLLTTTTDYTCSGVVPCSTWPMPAMPAAGSSYTDPTWRTTTYRLPVPSVNTSGQVIPTYSRVQAWNSDDTRMFLTETPGQAYIDLYDATTTPPTPINRITTTDGTLVDAYNGDAYWSNTIPTRIYYVPWGSGVYGGAGLQLRYIDVTNCTSVSCVLTPTIVHTFSCTSDSYFPGGSGLSGNVIESGSGGQGGLFDSTDTYFSFTCDVASGNGRGEIDFIRYNRQTDTVTTQKKWYQVCPGNVPSGCAVWTSSQVPRPGYNMIRMNQHQNANYITVGWQCAATNSTWTRGCGTEVFGAAYNFLGPASAGDWHQDNGFDVNGVPVWVGVWGGTNTVPDERSIEVTNLTTLSPSGITSKVIYLPCGYSRAGASPCAGGTFLAAKVSGSHISMTGSWGSLPGYALFSTMTLAGANDGYPVDMPVATTLGTAVTTPGVNTVTPASMASIGVGTQQVVDYGNANKETVTVTGVTPTAFTANFAKTHTTSAPVSNLTVGDIGALAMENIAVKIDTTAANGSPATFYRIGRAMSVRDADYNAEPHTAVNRDFTQIIWGSNWNVDGGKNYGFWTKLPPKAQKLAGSSTSPKSDAREVGNSQ
jgi:hypothetical protein